MRYAVQLKFGASQNDYGAKASRDLIVTRGAGFRKEKNKKKRGVRMVRERKENRADHPLLRRAMPAAKSRFVGQTVVGATCTDHLSATSSNPTASSSTSRDALPLPFLQVLRLYHGLCSGYAY